MPHPRKRTQFPAEPQQRLAQADPDAGDEAAAGGGGSADESVALRPEYTPAPWRAGDDGSLRFAAPTERYLDAARRQVRAKPLASAATAFAIGFLLSVITR